MRELFSADWYMLRKHGLIWWLCLCAAAIALAIVIAGVHNASEGYEIKFEGAPIGIGSGLTGAAAALVCGTVLDNAFTEGTIRNKIITGRSRAQVFWASYLVDTAAALLVFACYAVPLLIGMLYLAGPPADPGEAVQIIGYTICSIPAYTALYCAVCAIGGRKGVGMACLIVFAVLFIAAALLKVSLDEPEMIETYSWEAVDTDMVQTPDGAVLTEEIPIAVGVQPNPRYVAEPARSVYAFFLNAMPTGQSFQVVLGTHAVLPWYALGFCIVLCGIGLGAMERRNIN